MSKEYLIKNTTKLTINDIKAIFDGSVKVACLALEQDKFKNTKSLPKTEEYYINGLENDISDLIGLIVYSDKYDNKEKAKAYLNLFNKYIQVTKVQKLNIQEEYVSETFIGNFTRHRNNVVDFDGYAINTIKLQPALSEYLKYKLELLKQKIKIENKYTSCLEDIKELEK